MAASCRRGRCAILLFVWLALLYATGLLIFTRGFLLRRSAMTSRTEPGPEAASSYHRRAIVLLIDGLRYDFVRRHRQGATEAYHNRMSVVHDLMATEPNRTRLVRFVADPPTTTMQRIKALITGSLPTFVDASDNFASFEIDEDNVVDQLVSLGRKVVLMGDDTWIGLLPGRFHLAHPFPSFDVHDLHTVDDGIVLRLVPLLRSKGSWDVVIAHFLGVDHCGHVHGPYHRAMADKLSQMNDVLRSVVDVMDDDTVLFVLGDHGMTPSGDHGGDSPDEVNAALFIFSPGKRLGPVSVTGDDDVAVMQVDFASTLSLLLGLPIPFSNIGKVMVDLFEDDDHRSLALYSNVRQVQRYLDQYVATGSHDFEAPMRDLRSRFRDIEDLWKASVRGPSFRGNCSAYLDAVQELCRDTWAKFDLVAIAVGLSIVSVALASSVRLSHLALRLPYVYLVLGLSLLGLASLSVTLPVHAVVVPSLLALCQVLLVLFASSSCVPGTAWSRDEAASFAVAFVVFLSHFSNSFVVNEDSVTAFLVITVLWCNVFVRRWWEVGSITKKQQQRHQDVLVLVAATAVASVCIRLQSLLWTCREEQWWCGSRKLLLDPTGLHLVVACASVVSIVAVVSWLLRKSGNLNGSSPAVLCASYGPALVAVCTVAFWVTKFVGAMSLEDRVPQDFTLLPNAAMLVALVALAVVSACPLTIHEVVDDDDLQVDGDGRLLVPQVYRHLKANWQKHFLSSPSVQRKPLVVYGLASVFSAPLLVVALLSLQVLMVLSRLGCAVSFLLTGVAAACVLWCYAETKAPAKNEFSVPWRWVLLWSLMSGVGFYGTGHQQTFPSLQWEAAAIGATGSLSRDALPAAKLLANTFSSAIWHGLTLPALVLAPVLFRTTGDGQFALLDNERFLLALYQLGNKYLALQGSKLLAAMSAAALHRRHLMVWKIFAPRYVFEAVHFVLLCPVVLCGLLLMLDVHFRLSRWSRRKEKAK